MRKLITILFLLIAVRAYAPEYRVLYIPAGDQISGYEKLIKAITWVESMDGIFVYNPTEEAVGWFQIRQIRVDHYNRVKGTNFVLTDFYDYDLSREMFLFFAKGKSFEQASKDWNGSGFMTQIYWDKVKQRLK